MISNQTTCPNCGHKFDATEAFQKHLDVELHKQAEILKLQNASLIEEYKKKIELEKQDFEKSEKQKLWAIAQQKATEKISSELKVLQDDVLAKNLLIKQAQIKEIELLKKEQALKEKQENQELEMQKTLLLKTSEIEEAAKKKKDAEFDLVKKEFEKKLEDQMNLVKEMQRKAEQGSMQLQGEIQELYLEKILSETFIYDEIEEIKKGQKGADAVQTVKNEMGQNCGKIVFESKRTQNFGGDWIDKLKDDQRAVNADLAVLVTQTMPKDMERFGEKDGVYVCGFHEVKALVYILRQILIRTKLSESSQENKAEKMAVLYNYLVSNQFKQQMEAIVDGFKNLKEELDREKRAMHKIWKEREIQIDKVVFNTIDMYGSIKGIAGNAISPIQYLELGTTED